MAGVLASTFTCLIPRCQPPPHAAAAACTLVAHADDCGTPASRVGATLVVVARGAAVGFVAGCTTLTGRDLECARAWAPLRWSSRAS